jgi:lactate permease
MTWTQVIDPCHNRLASLGVALVPVLAIFWALVIRKIKGYQASLLATALALLVAIGIYRMPVTLALLSTFNGAIYGLFPICWIILPAVFLFNITVRSGQFTVIRHFMASITSDRRIQALLIAFSFGSFLEGTAGFGAPVAITAAMLTGLGFNPLYAAGICLIANTAPVAFGSIGIPITVASQVTGLPEQAISQMVGRTLPLLSALLPFYLVILMAGFRRAKEVAPAALVSGLSFALIQALSSNFLGPALPDVLAGIGSIIGLLVLLRWWRPKTIWRFPDESPIPVAPSHFAAASDIGRSLERPLAATSPTPPATRDRSGQPSLGAPASKLDRYFSNLLHGSVASRIGRALARPLLERSLLWALSPFIALTVIIIIWGLQPVKDWLNATGTLTFQVPGLHNAILDVNGHPIPHLYKLNYLSAAGTAIMLAALTSLALSGLRPREGLDVFKSTLHQLRYPILSIATVLAFAYIVNDSGITLTIAGVLAGSGVLFPFFAPLLGWLGVFITGSDTSANALFGKLQSSTAISIGVDPVVTVAANVSGGVVGKMISPQSIAVAAAAGGLVGRESELFRFTVRHSFILLAIICCLVLAQAYVFKWLIPVYHLHPLH